ncbi:MAG TPA: hypothetical protein VIA61_04455 [Methylomirabilota bacterium]|jgi:hypothetical protein
MIEAFWSFLREPFSEHILIPGAFLLGAAGLHYFVQRSRGLARGEEKYRGWQHEEASPALLTELPHQSLASIRRNLRIVEVDLMGAPSVAEFRTLGFDLAIGAVTVDVVSLLREGAHTALIVTMLALHLLLLLAILTYLRAAEASLPEHPANRTRAYAVIAWGALALISAFIFLSKGVGHG